MDGLEGKLKWRDVKEQGIKPYDFYKSNYAGLTRGKLSQKDQPLYLALKNADKLRYVPRKKTFGKNPVRYYRKHYPNVTRGKLSRVNNALYVQLERKDLSRTTRQRRVA